MDGSCVFRVDTCNGGLPIELNSFIPLKVAAFKIVRSVRKDTRSFGWRGLKAKKIRNTTTYATTEKGCKCKTNIAYADELVNATLKTLELCKD